MHDQGWVHRDIKPGNIFIKNDANRLVLKLGDFGSAHFIEMESTNASDAVPARGSNGVTVLYAAPETHTGEPYGRKCDIWSIGCCVFQMMTGRSPWSNRTRKLNEFSQILFEMEKKRDPLTFFGRLEPFTEERANFTNDAVSFLKACFVRKTYQRASVAQLIESPLLDTPA